jgi:hypothetical protein
VVEISEEPGGVSSSVPMGKLPIPEAVLGAIQNYPEKVFEDSGSFEERRIVATGVDGFEKMKIEEGESFPFSFIGDELEKYFVECIEDKKSREIVAKFDLNFLAEEGIPNTDFFVRVDQNTGKVTGSFLGESLPLDEQERLNSINISQGKIVVNTSIIKNGKPHGGFNHIFSPTKSMEKLALKICKQSFGESMEVRAVEAVSEEQQKTNIRVEEMIIEALNVQKKKKSST